MKKWISIALGLSVLTLSCDKDRSAGDLSPFSGLKGYWAPVYDDWQTDYCYCFENGMMSTYGLVSRAIVRDGILYLGSGSGNISLHNQEEYRVRDGVLIVGKNSLGECRVDGDTLLLGGGKLQRVRELGKKWYADIELGPLTDALSRTLITGKADKTIRIPVSLSRKVGFPAWFQFFTTGKRIDSIRLIPAEGEDQKDSISFHIDANETAGVKDEEVFVLHPAAGTASFTVRQLKTDTAIYFPEDVSVIDIPAEGAISLDLPYRLISPAGKSDVVSLSIPETWVETNSVSPTNISLLVRMNEGPERRMEVTLSYPGADNRTLTIRQAAKE